MKIKLRAWNQLADSGEMVTEENSGLKNYQILERFSDVMRYTEIKDSKGNEVYEGDIITAHYKYIGSEKPVIVEGKVVFKFCRFMVDHDHPEHGRCLRDLQGLIENGNTVVGNIYEGKTMMDGSS